MSDAPELFHIGKKIKRLRELKDIKQEALAAEVGISRQSISKIEQSDNIDEEMLAKIAKALKIPVEAIKNFNEDTVILHIQNMNDNSSNYQYNFNPIEKVVELYERLLQSERDKNELLTKNLEAATKK